MVKNRTLVPVIRSPPYSGIRSVIPSQVAESPRYNGQSRPSCDNWLHIHLIQAAADAADDNKRDDNKRKPNTCSWRHTKIVSCRVQLSTTVNMNTGFLCNQCCAPMISLWVDFTEKYGVNWSTKWRPRLTSLPQKRHRCLTNGNGGVGPTHCIILRYSLFSWMTWNDLCNATVMFDVILITGLCDVTWRQRDQSL